MPDYKNKLKAAKALRSLKDKTGATWESIGDLLGGVSASSLRVYASQSNHETMPDALCGLILSLGTILQVREEVPSGKLMLTLDNGTWRVAKISYSRDCAFCGMAFVPHVWNTLYCCKRCKMDAKNKRRRDNGG